MNLTWRLSWRQVSLPQTGCNSLVRCALPKENHRIDLAKRFAGDESGAIAIEYGLIAAGIAVAIIHVVTALGSQLKATFGNMTSQLALAGK
jgi:pilus assembly protein Flp/PilA